MGGTGWGCDVKQWQCRQELETAAGQLQLSTLGSDPQPLHTRQLGDAAVFWPMQSSQHPGLVKHPPG